MHKVHQLVQVSIVVLQAHLLVQLMHCLLVYQFGLVQLVIDTSGARSGSVPRQIPSSDLYTLGVDSKLLVLQETQKYPKVWLAACTK